MWGAQEIRHHPLPCGISLLVYTLRVVEQVWAGKKRIVPGYVCCLACDRAHTRVYHIQMSVIAALEFRVLSALRDPLFLDAERNLLVLLLPLFTVPVCLDLARGGRSMPGGLLEGWLVRST